MYMETLEFPLQGSCVLITFQMYSYPTLPCWNNLVTLLYFLSANARSTYRDFRDAFSSCVTREPTMARLVKEYSHEIPGCENQDQELRRSR
jgi:hypothetical protein